MSCESWYENFISDDEKDYTIQKKFPSGQTVKLELGCNIFDKCVQCNIYLTTAHKRKRIDDTYLQLNGKDGLHPLIWAKHKLIEFEDIVKKDFPDKKITIYTCWDDNRRRNVYHRGLKNVGYIFGNINGQKCLFKVL